MALIFVSSLILVADVFFVSSLLMSLLHYDQATFEAAGSLSMNIFTANILKFIDQD